jgi:hypothetical protein
MPALLAALRATALAGIVAHGRTTAAMGERPPPLAVGDAT